MGRSKDMDYKTALPDFMAIQRISFSWFISQGLCEELGYFHSTLDFSRTIETFIYSQEYKLTRPIYSSLECKRYGRSYVSKLQVLVEIRDKTANIILNRGRIVLVSLPLLTIESSFIINGCERTIVSQIIRSPGIYFEKSKKQRRKKRNRIKLSTRVHYTKLFIYHPLIVLRFSSCVNNFKPRKSNRYKDCSSNFDLYEFVKLYKYISTLVKPKNEIKLLLKTLFNSSNLILSFNETLKLNKVKRLQELLNIGSSYIYRKGSKKFFKRTLLTILNKPLLISEPKMKIILENLNKRRYFKIAVFYSFLRKKFTKKDLIKNDEKYDIDRENWYKKNMKIKSYIQQY